MYSVLLLVLLTQRYYYIKFHIILCRKSASCTHVSAVLHALTASTFQLRANSPSADNTDHEDEITPVTSLPCQWKRPKVRKESSLPMSEATFEKHDYTKPVKRKF